MVASQAILIRNECSRGYPSDDLGERIAAALLADPLEGALLNERYRIETRMGDAGAWVEAFAGRDVVDERAVTIEIVAANAVADRSLAAAFIVHAAALCELRHRHILRTLDHGTTEDGRPFLVRERPATEPLAQLLARNGWLPWPRIRTIALQLCSAITTIRSYGWTVHDLSAFGCQRVCSDRAYDDARLGELVPLTDLDPYESDERNDVFALGRIVAQLAQPTRAHDEWLPPDVAIPAELADVVMLATSPVPEQRFATVMQLGLALAAIGRRSSPRRREAVEPAAAGTIIVADTPQREPLPTPTARGRLFGGVAFTGVAALAIAAAMWPSWAAHAWASLRSETEAAVAAVLLGDAGSQH